ncbi:hypothetical protein [Salinivibrio sp. SS2]|uniref:hypothetical protein n=1 Tax=Salinivibrio sp. SS2 TaxID=1892894 RepID=UPI00084C3AF1|nr:hypothetical protein [Salinivibrio sp. DV]ODQ00551.1 hypothetical protein BGK46_06440 [Salinivibrio sp. DV]
MQINEIHELSIWYQSQVQKNSIAEHIHKIITLLKKNIIDESAIRKSITNQVSVLLSAITKINCSELTGNQRACLTHMNISSAVLEGAHENFSNIFDMRNNDRSFVVSTLERHLTSLQSAKTAFSHVQSSLPKIVPKEFITPIHVPEGKVLTRLTFQHEASIENLVEFSTWAKRWNMIARGFSMAINESAEDFSVVNADKGSLIVDILAGAAAMKLICEALKALTDLAISLTELKSGLDKLKTCKELFDEEKFEEMLSDAQKRLNEKEDEVVDSVIDKLSQKGLVKNDNAKNDLARAIKEVHRFNSAGGSMTCLASNDETFSTEDSARLNESYNALQDFSELKLIEEKREDSE